MDIKCHSITTFRSEVLQIEAHMLGHGMISAKERVCQLHQVDDRGSRPPPESHVVCQHQKEEKNTFCSNSGGSGKKAAHCLLQAASLEDSTEKAATSRQAFSFHWNIPFPPHNNSLLYIATYVTGDVKYILPVMAKV